MRVRRAWHRWASQNSEVVTYEDFAAAIAAAEERGSPYSPSAVSEWIAERSEPKARTYRAMARITGFREAWLMSGEMPERSEEGGQGAKPTNGSPKAPQAPKRTPPPLQQPEVIETHYLTPGKKKATPKRRRDDRSAIAS